MLLLNQLVTLVRRAQNYAETAASQINSIIAAAGNRPFLTSLSGGSTPFPVYRHLAKILADNGAGQRCHWIQTDERLVSAQDERSNQRGIKDSLMENCLLPQNSFMPVITDKPPADQSPAAFTALCRNYYEALMALPEQLRPPAPIDLVILGVGTDGHTASLFPDTDWQSRTSPTGFAVFRTASQPEARFSLTLERIMQARAIVFLVTGAGKQQVLQKVFFDPSFVSPAAYIARHRQATWILDEEAAGEKIVSQIKLRENTSLP